MRGRSSMPQLLRIKAYSIHRQVLEKFYRGHADPQISVVRADTKTIGIAGCAHSYPQHYLLIPYPRDTVCKRQ